MKQLLALIQSPDHVCYRYRVAAFAEALQQRGIHLQPQALARGTADRLRQFAQLRRADAVLLQRRLLPVWQLLLLRRAARCLIFDVDDAVYQRDSFHPKGPRSTQRRLRYWATVTAADRVIAGNDHLRQRTAGYVKPQKVSVIPTCVDPRRYRLAEHRQSSEAIRLVWIGQRSTLPSLDGAREHLAYAASDLPGLSLRVISNCFPVLRGVCVERCFWSEQTEAARLAEADVGVSWLPDDEWSAGKCGLKVLQYMAAGLPVVANRVGIHARLVIPGRTGFLADTPKEWQRAITRLAHDAALRRQMGRTARHYVEQHYDVAKWGPIFAETIHLAARRECRLAQGPVATAR